MPIREKSFRIGSGRYVQERGILNSIGAEVLRLGKSPFIVGGKTALSLTSSRIKKSLEGLKLRYRILEHTGTCNDEDAKILAQAAFSEGYDVIVGVGGGVIMDFAKMVAHFADLPVVNVPTSSATCAAYTPLSVRYTREGQTVGSFHHECEVNAVLVDTDIIATEPPRLLLAGVFDAMAKFLEIKHRYHEEDLEYPLGLDFAYVLSERTYRDLVSKTEKAINDIRNGIISEAFEQVVFDTVAVTGVISGIARGSNQCALAHKFYEITRVLFAEETREYLHGELVGVGLVLQNIYNGEESRNEELFALMKRYDMPFNISGVGVDSSEETLLNYYERLKNTSSINKDNEDECSRLLLSLRDFWNFNPKG